MKFSLKLLDSESSIRKQILEAMKNTLESAIKKSQPAIIASAKELIAAALKAEPEYSALTTGQLRYDFGIPDPNQVDLVIQSLVDTVNISSKAITVTNFGLSGGFVLTMMKSDDMNGVIDLDAAVVVDDTRGYRLPWLKWLLYEGGNPIVKNYEVKLGPNKASRTGFAIMIGSSSSWRVPAEFSGTITNNWTTRAIDRTETEINRIIQKEIENYL
jgi:hypothetical protein